MGEPEPNQPLVGPAGTPFSRRQLLKVGSGATVALLAQRAFAGTRAGQTLFGSLSDATLPGPSPLAATYAGLPSFVVRAVRPADMFAVDLRFVNLKVISSTDGPRLVRSTAAPAFVLLELPPQAVLEQAFPEGSEGTEPFQGRVGTLLSGPSRLAFLVPATVKYIPYRLDAVLDLTRLPASVVPPGQRRLPSPTESLIEAPWDLALSPDPAATWTHARTPVTRGTRTELWHTRLAPRQSDGTADNRVGAPSVPVRAVERLNRPDPGWLVPLTASDRTGIVDATSGSGTGVAPAQASRLHLSPLGSSLSIDAKWDGPSLDGWRHRSTLGRDHYVQVDTAGYLAPFGHRATLVTITERKFRPGGAYLFKRQFVVVKRPVKDFPTLGEPNAGRRMPLRRVTITDTVSPDITQEPAPPPESFWPLVNGRDLIWRLVGEDVEGRRVPLFMPLLFVARGGVDDTGQVDASAHGTRGAAVADYFSDGRVGDYRRTVALGGLAVAFAPPDKPGDTALEVDNITFGAEATSATPPAGLLAADQPNFYPTFGDAGVRLPATQAIKGQGEPPKSISFYSGYVQNGFAGPNTKSVFCQLLDAGPLALPAATVGGVAAPDLYLVGLSREFGAVSSTDLAGGIDNALDQLNTAYSPKNYFPDSARLLGSLKLSDVLAPVTGALPPALLNEKLFPNGDATKVPDAIKTTLRFKPPLQDFPPAGPSAFHPLDPMGLELVVTLVAKVAGPTPSSATVRGDLRNFELRLPPATTTADAAIAVFFDRLGFVSENGGKPTFDVKLRDVTFGGPLTFVQDVRQFLKTPGSGLSIDVAGNGITAGYTITLPPISVGAFALQNVALSAGVELPFDDRPVRLRFSFCTRERPFLLTFSLFAGGGFFAVKVSANGLELVEAALEFGAAASLNLGVASGSVSVMAGVYFKSEGSSVTLSGYVRLNGELEVLGLISISVEFYMGLSYESATQKVTGRATLTVKVRVLFFSTSVSLSVERKFGGGGDPFFGELVSPADWNDYCDAFAEVA